MSNDQKPSEHDLHSDHTPHAIRRRLAAGPQHVYLRDFIYGAIDGAVTTFAIVAGVAGARLEPGIVVVLGLANVLADGFSMAVSNMLGRRAEDQVRARTRRDEELHIDVFPEGEREEIRQIFAAKGFKGEQLEQAVQIITSDRQRWVDTMITEEHGLPLDAGSIWKAAAATFFAFLAIGLLPLAPYIFETLSPGTIRDVFLVSAVMTGVAFFVVGAIKSRFVGESWCRAGLETLLMGGVAASLAYVVGATLRHLASGV